MEYLLLIIAMLLIIIFALSAKIYFLRKSAIEILEAFHEKLTADTNTLIDISSRDTCMRRLASGINQELELLKKKRHRYHQGDLELKEAVANMSHDLRTPLTAINGYLDLLEKEEKTQTTTHYLSRIRNRTEVLKNLTEELFLYSIITSSPALNPEPLNLVRVLEESLLSFYALMQKKKIQPQIALPPEAVWVTLDKSALNRIFSNIINNAIKYSDGDFIVTMDENGCITFSNTAHSLNAVMVSRLFDRFYTVSTSRNSTGLGLSIAKILTGQMGGSIEAAYLDGVLSIMLVFK